MKKEWGGVIKCIKIIYKCNEASSKIDEIIIVKSKYYIKIIERQFELSRGLSKRSRGWTKTIEQQFRSVFEIVVWMSRVEERVRWCIV